MRALALIAALLPLSVAGCSNAEISVSERCDVAASYIASELGASDEPIVFATGDEMPSIAFDASQEVVDQIADRPWGAVGANGPWNYPVSDEQFAASEVDAELLRQLFALNGLESSVTQCDPVRRLLVERQVPFGEAAVDEAIRNRNTAPDPQADVIEIANSYLPLVSRSRDVALLVESRSSGPLAAGGIIVRLERNRVGEWIATGLKVLWYY